MVIKRVMDDIAPGEKLHVCPNCEQETDGDSCRWCGYPIITDDAPRDKQSSEEASELDSALRRAAEKRSIAEKTLREAEEKARSERDERASLEAEERAKREARERMRREVEEKARREAEEKARRKADKKASKEAEARAKREAKEKAKQEAEAARRAKLEEMKAAREAERVAKERAKRWADELKKTRKQAEIEAKQQKKKEARKDGSEEAQPLILQDMETEAKSSYAGEGNKKDSNAGGGGNGVFRGSVRLVLSPPVPTAAMRNFEAALSGIDGMSMGLMSGSDNGGLNIDVFCENPVNIVERLNGLPPVAKAAKEGKRAVRVALKTE